MERLCRLSFARLDRIYTTMSTQDVLDRCPRSGTAWPSTNLLAPSDHCPVYLSLSTCPPAGPLRIPTWIATQHHFSDTLDL
eukprot:3318083-Pyramimonas_sp.AAC.1